MDSLADRHIDFIHAQPMFFVATAGAEGRVNLSPKGMDSLRVVNSRRLIWLNLTGSGNETAAHVAANNRMTLMFMSITEQPLILRIYGAAQVIHPRDSEWKELIGQFPRLGGSRQIFDLAIEHTSASCGTGVPIMSVNSNRGADELEPFYAEMSEAELHAYWRKKNVTSIDGLPTGIFDDW